MEITDKLKDYSYRKISFIAQIISVLHLYLILLRKEKIY